MTGKQMFVRTTLTLGLPFILVWAFFEVLLRDVRSAFWFAWLEVRCNVESYHREMEREDY